MGKIKHFTQKQKLSVLKSAEKIGVKKASLAADVHYTSVYEWRNKHKAMGEEEFLSYSPTSRGRGEKRITEEQEKLVKDMCERYPGFGPSQVRNQLRRQGKSMSTRTVRSIMEANGYKSPRKNKETEPDNRFEATRPLELVQMDILELFINKVKVYLFFLLDDFSRFLTGWSLVTETSVDELIKVVRVSIDRYGKMEEMLSDRGFVFYSWRGVNRFEKYLEVERIDHTHASPHHPKTLGKIEAVNKQIQKELYRIRHFQSVADARDGIGQWVDVYNYERTHQGMGGLLVPADRFMGRVPQVMESIKEKADPALSLPPSPSGVERSIVNLVLGVEGDLTLYVMGKSLRITGERDV